MIIVCDASPLIALSVCDKLDLLDTLFKEVVIPEGVYSEVSREGKPEAGKIAAWAQGKVHWISFGCLLSAYQTTFIRIFLHWLMNSYPHTMPVVPDSGTPRCFLGPLFGVKLPRKGL
jgi:hypothetical protein